MRKVVWTVMAAALSWAMPALAQQGPDATLCVAIVDPTPGELDGLSSFVERLTAGVSHCRADNVINLLLAYNPADDRGRQAARVAVPLLCDYSQQVVVNVWREAEMAETYSVSCVFVGMRRLVLPRQ